MIERIRITGYKSLRDVELHDLSNLVVFFGANAAGKSNFFDALDLLGHLARADTVQQAFQQHRGNRSNRPLPVRQFFTSGDESVSRLTFEVDLNLQPGLVRRVNLELVRREKREKLKSAYTRLRHTRLRYRLEISYDPARRALEITDEGLWPLTSTGSVHESIKPFVHKRQRALIVKLERQSHPRGFELPRPRTVLSEVGDLVNHPHVVAVAAELASISVYYLEPHRMRSEVSDVEVRTPGTNGQSLASYFYWLSHAEPRRYANVQVNLRRLIPGFQRLEIRESSDGFLELWVAEGERGEFPASLLSEGTLRLLCLVGILASPEPPSVVGYEEPENGVHPGRLGDILRMLEEAGRRGEAQILLTTHSPDVLDRLERQPRFRLQRGAKGTEVHVASQLPLFRLSDRRTLGDVGSSDRLGARLSRGELG